jgi:hypothetical protein
VSVSNDRYYKPFIFYIIQIISVIGADTKYRFTTDTTNTFCSSVTESCVGNGTARALKFPGWPAGSFLPVIFSSLAGGPSIERHHRRDETCAHFPRWRANGRYRLNRDSFTRALLLSFPCVGGAQQGNWGRASCCRPEPPCPSPPTTLLPLGSRPT